MASETLQDLAFARDRVVEVGLGKIYYIFVLCLVLFILIFYSYQFFVVFLWSFFLLLWILDCLNHFSVEIICTLLPVECIT